MKKGVGTTVTREAEDREFEIRRSSHMIDTVTWPEGKPRAGCRVRFSFALCIPPPPPPHPYPSTFQHFRISSGLI
jgi:hypothetical protein